MSCTPTVSIIGQVIADLPHGPCSVALSAALEGVTSFSPIIKSLTPGEIATVPTPGGLTTFFMVITNREVNIRFAAEDIRIDRMLILFGEGIGDVELRNELQNPAASAQVSVYYSIDGELV